MYTDPSLIRDQFVKIRLNEREATLLDSVVAYTGQQKSTFLRELLLEQAALVLSGQADFVPSQQFSEEPQLALNFQR